MVHRLLLLLFCLSPVVLHAQNEGISDLKKGKILLLTQDSHDSWLDWSNDDKYIYYISAKSGNPNLYRIRVDDVPFMKIKGRYQKATYLHGKTKSPVEQLTFEKDRIVECPVVLPNSNRVAYRSYICDEGCSDFNIRIYDHLTKASTTILDVKSYAFDFITDDSLLYVPHDAKSKIMLLKVSTGEKSVYLDAGENVTGLQVRHSANLLFYKTDKAAFKVNPAKQEPRKIYNGKIGFTRIDMVGDKVIGTFKNIYTPASGTLDLSTKQLKLIFDSYDYEPSVSCDGKFVAAIDESMQGIVLKRLD